MHLPPLLSLSLFLRPTPSVWMHRRKKQREGLFFPDRRLVKFFGQTRRLNSACEADA